MAWYKSSNYKVNSSALNLTDGFVGDMFVVSGSYNDEGVFTSNVQYVNAYNKPAVLSSQTQLPFYEGMGSVLTVKEKMLSNGYTYKMPVWSDKPLCSTNFPTGIVISGYLYQPFRLQLCNAGINYTVELLGRIVN
jgi:hypothetical protein